MMLAAEQKREQIIDAEQVGVNGHLVLPFMSRTLREEQEKIYGSIEC